MRIAFALVLVSTVAAADPGGTPVPDPPKPRRQPVSLRAEATRIATEMAAVESRSDPDLLLVPFQIGRWSANGRAGSLSAGAAAATFAGEMLMHLGIPIAAVGAFATGATLDSAAADVEAASEPEPPRKPVLHRLGR